MKIHDGKIKLLNPERIYDISTLIWYEDIPTGTGEFSTGFYAEYTTEDPQTIWIKRVETNPPDYSNIPTISEVVVDKANQWEHMVEL